MQENLAQLAKDKSSRNLPRPVESHDPFVEFIGFKEIEEKQLKYLLPTQQPSAAAAYEAEAERLSFCGAASRGCPRLIVIVSFQRQCQRRPD